MTTLQKIVRGATFWIPGTGPASDPNKAHLYIALLDPCHKGVLLRVPICTAHDKCDQTCLLGEGDHHFLNRKSFVDYALTKFAFEKAMMASLQKGMMEYRGMLDGKLFGLVAAGVLRSRATPPKLAAYYTERTAADEA